MTSEDSPRLIIEIQPADFGLLVSLTGELDGGTAALFQRRVADLVTHAGPLYVLLDLSGLSFCDSSGLASMIGLWRHVTDGTGLLVLTGVHGRTARLLTITAMNGAFAQYPTRDDAITALTAAQPLLHSPLTAFEQPAFLPPDDPGPDAPSTPVVP